jgi:hypothetical protein
VVDFNSQVVKRLYNTVDYYNYMLIGCLVGVLYITREVKKEFLILKYLLGLVGSLKTIVDRVDFNIHRDRYR